MPLADFVHLRVHTAYSLSAGAIKIKELADLCKAERMPAVAITDTGNLFGALEFATTCSGAGVQPIIGCEIALCRGNAEEGNRLGRIVPEPDRIVLLVQDEAGYRNLLRLVSRSYLAGEAPSEPAIGQHELAGASEGLLCLAGGPKGPVGRLLAEGQIDAAEAALTKLAVAFPNRLYVELMRHGTPEEARSEPGLVELAYRHGLPLVATNNVHFPDHGFYEAHDALLCIAQGKVVGDADRKRLTGSHYFRPAAEMRAVFADLPEACDNTLVIARRCAFMPVAQKPILPPFPTQSGLSEADELRAMAAEGLERRLVAQVVKAEMSAAERDAAAQPYRDRLTYELDVIIKMGFAG